MENVDQLQCTRSHLKKFLAGQPLKKWFESRISTEFEPFYSSIDIRDAGFKLAPVDANLFPAGFNNICPEDLHSGEEIIRPLLQSHLGKMPKKIAILPENHTKNKYYVDNVIELLHLFKRMGIETAVGWWDAASVSREPIDLEGTQGHTLRVYPFYRVGNRLLMDVVGAPFDADFILINNDFSSGYPQELEGLEQPMEPSPKMGWHTRRKSDFFTHYNALAAELARDANLDPWCLQVDTRLVTDVDFDTNQGMDKIAAAVDDLVVSISVEYKKRDINEKPFVFVKSNAGTYGMGIMKIESGAELLSLNRRERNKMAVVKNQLQVREVIVQEGIPTRFQIDGVIAEPAIYLFGRELMGGFLRKNPTRGRGDNLNSKGMVFQKLCLSDLRNGADRDMELEMVYGTIAQLSAAAMGAELKTSKLKQTGAK